MIKKLRYTRIVGYSLLFFIGFPTLCHAQLNTDRITAIGRNALYFDDYVLSIQYFNQIIRLKPYLSEPYLLRGIAKTQLADYQGALQDLDASIVRNPFQPGAYYTRGFVYRQLGNLKKAEEDFTQALRYAPENRTYMLMRADVYSQQKRFVEALNDIDYLIGHDSKSASLHFEKGIICLAKQDTLGALQSFLNAVQYDSQNPSNYSALGLVYLMQGNDDEALVHLTKSINFGSKWAGDYVNRGIIFYRKHNYRGALHEYDQAVAIAPDDGSCYYNRGILRQELGDYNRALDDFNRAIELCRDQTEMLYQRATVLLQLRQWNDALQDLDEVIAGYPYFLPAYYLAAQAKTALGDTKSAYRYRYTAAQLESKKDSISQAIHDSLNAKPHTDVLLAKSQPQKRDHRKEFSQRQAQNQTEQNDNMDNNASSRGSVQHQHVDVLPFGNIVLSYYAQPNTLQQTHYYHYTIDEYNRHGFLPSALHLTIQEIALTATMVNQHFEQITRLSERIDRAPSSDLYVARAMEFAIVQDYTSAIDDCTRAIQQLPNMAWLYFSRANWRYKQLEFLRASGELTKEHTLDFEIMLRDYDYVNRLEPDFPFAYYNKANMLCAQNDYKTAIQFYTRAIDIEPNFAEAYFNRGLTYIFTDQNDLGIADLSKAGELGIYQAYNLITRFR